MKKGTYLLVNLVEAAPYSKEDYEVKFPTGSLMLMERDYFEKQALRILDKLEGDHLLVLREDVENFIFHTSGYTSVDERTVYCYVKLRNGQVLQASYTFLDSQVVDDSLSTAYLSQKITHAIHDLLAFVRLWAENGLLPFEGEDPYGEEEE